ncbi:MAG TPA: PilN domain-containing protein [Thermoanaerobaculia bacterium]|nr:PilN domain-containing protein [Thermoanaerobaculia bacterium]
MRVLHPNLASRPYRDYRPVWAVAALLVVLTGALFAYNLQTAWRYFATTQETRAEIEDLERQIAKERERTATARQALERFDTVALRERSAFVNARIAERTFSWSKMLDDLESVVPDDVRLTRLAPNPTSDGTYSIAMDCLAKTDEGMVNLIQALFASPKFDRPNPTSESVAREGLFRFSLTVEYQPTPKGVRK